MNVPDTRHSVKHQSLSKKSLLHKAARYSSVMTRPFIVLLLCLLTLRAAPLTNSTLQSYFAAKARKIATDSLRGIDTLDQWEAARPKYRAQLFEMLGLYPLPPKTDLHATITGKLE